MSRNNRMPPQVETASNSSSGPRIQQRLTDQQRINTQLLQKVQVLEEKYDQLEQQMQQQTEAAANLPLSKTPIKGREDYNNLLCRDYREAYEHCGKEWDLDRSLMNKQGNYDILQEVIRIALQSDLVKRLHGDPTSATGFKSPAQKDTAIQMIRSHFDYLRDVRNQQVRLSEDQRRRRRYRRKVAERRNRKFTNRRIAFSSLENRQEIQFPDGDTVEKEECEPLLLKEIMSEEEDDEELREGVAKNLRLVRLNWRSEKANYFFDYLDTKFQESAKQNYQRLDRRVEEVNSVLPARLRRQLPAWAISNDQ